MSISLIRWSSSSDLVSISLFCWVSRFMMSILLVLRVSSNSLTFLFKTSLSFSSLLISHSLFNPSSWSFIARGSFGFRLFLGSKWL